MLLLHGGDVDPTQIKWEEILIAIHTPLPSNPQMAMTPKGLHMIGEPESEDMHVLELQQT